MSIYAPANVIARLVDLDGTLADDIGAYVSVTRAGPTSAFVTLTDAEDDDNSARFRVEVTRVD